MLKAVFRFRNVLPNCVLDFLCQLCELPSLFLVVSVTFITDFDYMRQFILAFPFIRRTLLLRRTYSVMIQSVHWV